MEHKIDFTYLDGVAEVSSETAIELIDYFLHENHGWLENLKLTAKNKQPAELKDALHKLKGAIRVLGLSFIDSYIETWEFQLKQNATTDIPQKLEQMEAFFEIASKALTQKRIVYLK